MFTFSGVRYGHEFEETAETFDAFMDLLHCWCNWETEGAGLMPCAPNYATYDDGQGHVYTLTHRDCYDFAWGNLSRAEIAGRFGLDNEGA